MLSNTKPFYFLHPPRCAGTSIVQNLSSIFGEPNYKHANGNPIDNNGEWLPFWTYSIEKQLCLINGSRFVCNERLLGCSFHPELFDYITCIRDPIEQRLSIISYRLGEFLGYRDIGSIGLNDIHNTFLESYARFPANYLTWMLAAPAEHYTVSRRDLSLAGARLSQFKVIRLNAIGRNFKSLVGSDFQEGLGRNASIFKLRLSDLDTKDQEMLTSSTKLDQELLSSYCN